MTERPGVTGDHADPAAGEAARGSGSGSGSGLGSGAARSVERAIGDGRERASSAHARVRAVDVALAANVSISTVSLVVNDKWEGRVAAETVARVRSEVARLGYVVDESARRLATGAAAAVAVVTPAFTNPFYARVSLGAAAALGSAFQVVFSVPEIGDDPVATLDRLRGLRLAGALVAAPSHELLRALAPELPTIVLDAPDAGSGRPRVDLDVAGGARALAEHLLGLGHRRLAYLRALPESETFAVRHAALAGALSAAGAELIVPEDFASEVDAGAAHTVSLAAIDELVRAEVSAVVCATDLHAYGLLRACAERGVQVPAQWSVAGFDDQPLSAYVSPALTSVAFPADELGREAGRLLADLIAGERDAAELPAVTVLPVSLAVRASTGPAPLRR